VSMVFMRVRLGQGSYGADDTGSMTIRVGVDSLVDRAVFTGNLLVDGMADLPGNWVAFFHRGGNWDLDWNIPALSDGLSGADSLRDLSNNSVAGGDWLGVADGGRNIPGGCFTDSFWNSNTLRNRHTLGNSNTLGNSDALGNSDTSWNSNLTDSLDRNLSALSVNLLLALRSNGNWGSSNGNWGSSKSKGCWASSKTTHWECIKSKELSISIGFSISFGISFTFCNSLGKELSSSRNNTSRKAIVSKSSSNRKTIESKSSREWARSNQTSSRESIDNSLSWGSMGDDIAMSLNMNPGVGADLMDDILALLYQSCLRNRLCLSGALLLCGALLLLCALLLSCALRYLSTLLLSLSAALLVWHLGHNVPALLLSVGGALLLWDCTADGGALLDRGGGTFFLGFCSEVCDSSCVADWLSDCGACL